MTNYNSIYENYIDKQLLELEKNGSKFNRQWLIEIKKELLDNFLYNNGTLENFTLEICEETIKFINSGVIAGISSCIYLPKNTYELNIYGGYQDYHFKDKINDKTLFDIASITKLFTLLLTFKLEELNLLDLNKKVSEITDFKLEDFTLNDLIKMLGLIETHPRIDECLTVDKASEVLKKITVINRNKEKNTYTDMGLIVLSKTIEKVINEEYNLNLSFDQIMDKYLLKPLGLSNTTFHPLENVAGNAHQDKLPHDAKARILGPIGSAGLFSNSYDLAKMFEKLYQTNYLSEQHLNKLFERINEKSSLGYAGINLKHDKGIIKSFSPNEYSKQTYAHQGFTGSVIINDPINLIHNNFLISSIRENEKSKPKDFMQYYNNYQLLVVKKTLEILITKKLRDCYLNEKITKVIHLD